MALTLKLVWGTTEISLQGGTAGFQLLDDGWLPRVTGSPERPVVESLRVRVSGTTHDNLATYMQSLSAFQRYAAEYRRDAQQIEPVWLVVQTAAETGQRRALVRAIEWEFVSGWFDGAASAANKQALVMTVERAPFWEAMTSTTLVVESPAPAVCVTYNPGTIGGDVPARQAASVMNLTASVQLARLWIGIRSSAKHSAAENLQNIWELEDGTAGTDAALLAVATASPGGAGNTALRITPGTAGWAKRVSITLNDVVDIVTYPNLQQQFGTFVWLVRARVSAGAWRVRLHYGYADSEDADFIVSDAITVAGTEWDFYHAGVQDIPVRNAQATRAFDFAVNAELYNTVQVWAERIEGSGTLDVDCMVLIPVDEGYVFIENMNLAENQVCRFQETARGTIDVHTVTGVFTRHFPAAEWGTFRPRPGTNRYFIAVARSDRQVITDTISVSARNFRAYRSWRGAG